MMLSEHFIVMPNNCINYVNTFFCMQLFCMQCFSNKDDELNYLKGNITAYTCVKDEWFTEFIETSPEGMTFTWIILPTVRLLHEV